MTTFASEARSTSVLLLEQYFMTGLCTDIECYGAFTLQILDIYNFTNQSNLLNLPGGGCKIAIRSNC